MGETTPVKYARFAAEHVVAVDATPPEVRAAFARFEGAQRDGAETSGSVIESSRRYELDGGALAYLPEIGLPTTALGVITMTAFVLAVVLILAGIFIASDGPAAGRYAAYVGGALLVAAVILFRRYNRKADARRAGVETLGLYLLPTTIVLRKVDGCRVFPRQAVAGFCGVRLRDQNSNLPQIVIELDGGDGEHYHVELTRGRHTALLGYLSGWLTRDTTPFPRS